PSCWSRRTSMASCRSWRAHRTPSSEGCHGTSRTGPGSKVIAVVGRRLLALPLILLAVSLLVFLLAWASPYDPAEAYVQGAVAGDALTPELRAQFERPWGLEDPMPVQFLNWLGQLLQGDLGESRYLAGAPVADALLDRAYPSLVLLG